MSVQSALTFQQVNISRVEAMSVSEANIPEKTLSLRHSSLLKRLDTNNHKKTFKTVTGRQKKSLSKYRRKSANKKERERMKKLTDMFTVLGKILPGNENDKNTEKEQTKVIGVLFYFYIIFIILISRWMC